MPDSERLRLARELSVAIEEYDAMKSWSIDNPLAIEESRIRTKNLEEAMARCEEWLNADA